VTPVHTSNNLEATFSIVERIVKLVAFDNVAWTLLLVWTRALGAPVERVFSHGAAFLSSSFIALVSSSIMHINIKENYILKTVRYINGTKSKIKSDENTQCINIKCTSCISFRAKQFNIYSLITCLGSDNLGKLYFKTKNEIKSRLNHNKVRSITLELLAKRLYNN